MLVKICGLRTPEHALAAQAAGADLLGLVFAPSRRQVTPAVAAAIVAAVRATPGPHPLIVGLFVNTPPSTISAVAAQVGLDYVQLSGDEPVSYVDHIALPLLKTVRMDGSPEEAAWIARAEAGRRTPDAGHAAAEAHSISAERSSLLLLVDAHVPGSYGGTGVAADWARAAALAARAPTMLAGGLSPANVAAAIAAVRPLGVDVSSGVESAGIKDLQLIEAFVGAAHAAH